MATCAATAAGWLFGRLTVPLPSFILFVESMRLAINIRHEVIGSALSVICSPIKASLKPNWSASIIAFLSSFKTST